MKFITIPLFVALFIIQITGCKKDAATGSAEPVTQSGSMNNLKVPNGFNWETSRSISFTVSVSDTRFRDALHVISIFDGDPKQGGQLLSKGSASIKQPFSSRVYLASVVRDVYIVKTAPDNSELVEKVQVNSSEVNLTFGKTGVINSAGTLKAAGRITAAVGDGSGSPDCSTGCSKLVALSGGDWVNVENGQTVCVSGNDKTFNVTFGSGGGTIRICGTNLSLQNINNNSNGAAIRIVVTAGTSVTFPGLNLNGSNNSLENYGICTFPSNLSLPGTLYNAGTLVVNADYNANLLTNPATTHINTGTISVAGSMNIGATCTFTNNASVTVGRDLQVNGQASFINNCNLWVKGNYNHSSIMKNYSYIRVDGATTVNGGTELSLLDGSMVRTNSMMLNGSIKGYGSNSVVKVLATSTINGGGSVVNQIIYCDANGIETNNGSFTGGASQGCSTYIPVSSCNPEGNGAAPVLDTDGDKIPDSQDAYPNDASKAYNNYYPAEGSYATVAFEDKWPLKGDYDLNDLVIGYRYKVVTNAQNQVVEVAGDYTLYAAGGDFENGFGVEFPIGRESVASLSGGTLEPGQENAVVVLFTNMRKEMPAWNTRPGQAVTAPKNYTVNFSVSNGPLLKDFGLNPYNPFIWNNTKGYGRGYEVHLPGKKPTVLANSALFGTNDDATSREAGKYYVSKDNLPWALNIPASQFDYPVERQDISSAYVRFGDWARSGGTQFDDWYLGKGSSYRNDDKIFKR